MKASPEQQKELLRLQALDTRLAQVEHQARTLAQLAELTALAGQAEKTRATLAARNGCLLYTSDAADE